MAKEIICLDTSILIDFFRKKKKENTVFYKLTLTYQIFAVSVITEYEIFSGSTTDQLGFWESFFSQISVLPFDSETDAFAVKIFKQLKARNKLIDIPDILIAATAVKNNMKLATINRKHFDRVGDLELVDITVS
ncbi:MAG: type II toxin-antitoxin system VapC family toxin [Bacteroidia bacterium]